ncbi:MAG: hypothetical protein KJP06_05200 [Deltaproteobacteria bacterium]|nr:hypothetical protein [Deltaproteobacteria bacterium]
MTIGDAVISIAGEFQNSRRRIQPNYRPFQKNGQTDITLQLHRESGLSLAGKKIFDSSPIWQLYRKNGTSVFKIFDAMPGLARTLVLPPELNRADLYFAEPSARFLDPFYGPTVELLMINYLARGRGVILHGCGIERGGKGYLFAGESGAGKSTLARLWDRQKGVAVLSDDRTIVRKKDGHYWMYGTPWHGEAKFGLPRGVKLEKIFFLRHASRNKIHEVAGASSVTQFLKCSFPPYWDAAGMEFAMQFFSELAASVPCQMLAFKPDKHVIGFISAMK